MAGEEDFERLVETARKAGAALRDSDVPYALGGGLAARARGGPKTGHDIDFLIKPEDGERAPDVPGKAGFKTQLPLEDWPREGSAGGPPLAPPLSPPRR